VQLSALRLVETSCCLAPDDVSATEHSASPVLLRGTACHPTFELHQHYQLLKTVSRLICFCSLTLYSLIRSAYFLYGALVVTLRTCYGALQIVVLLLFIIINWSPFPGIRHVHIVALIFNLLTVWIRGMWHFPGKHFSDVWRSMSLLYTGWPKKLHTKLMVITLSILNGFSKIYCWKTK